MITPVARKRHGVWDFHYDVNQRFNGVAKVTLEVEFTSSTQAVQFLADVLTEHVVELPEDSTNDRS